MMLRKLMLLAVAMLVPTSSVNALATAGVSPPPVITAPRPQIELPPAPPAPPPVRQPASLRIKGQKTYVYSFLDVRDDELGREVVGQFHRQLIETLQREGVTPTLKLFGDSNASAFYIPQPKIPNGRKVVDRVPVVETIMANRAAETAFGARYRLLVLPANFEMAGAWRFYTIRWILMDAEDNAILWRGDYKGKHLTMWRTNENAEGRGRKLMDGGIDLMRQGGVL